MDFRIRKMSGGKVCLLCLIGLPGAGKTFLASTISKTKVGFTKVEHVSFDKLISWEQNNLGIMWKDKRRAVFVFVENLIVNFRQTQSKCETLLVILDDNMYYRSMRYEFYGLARKFKTKYCQVYLDTPLDVCCERNKLRDIPLPTNHITNINEKLEKPLKNCYWEEYSIVLTENLELSGKLEAIQELVLHCKEAVKLKKYSESKQCQQSGKHLADIALRRIITKFIQEIKKSQMETVPLRIKNLVETKKKLLESIHNGDLSLPKLQTVDEYVDHFLPIFQETTGKVHVK